MLQRAQPKANALKLDLFWMVGGDWNAEFSSNYCDFVHVGGGVDPHPRNISANARWRAGR